MYSRNRLDDRSLELFYRKFYRPLYGGIVEPTESWFREQSLNGGRILEWLKQNGFGRDGFRGKRVVDIGAGAGGGLIPFIECGAEALGIDFDENFLDFGRKHGVVMEVGGINDLKDYGLFDLVILKDVLEHLPNPSKAIAQVRQSLKSDGVCFIQVPGFQSLKHLGYQNDLLRYFQVAHLVHFTKESLTLLVESGGMNVHVADNRVWMIATRRDAPKNIESNHCDNFQAKVALRSIFRLRRFTAIEFYILRHLPPICKSALRFLIRR
jgi:2-polyprenyl-3-methyl-5-hydroxy-6-metoxy-1,4-benzoquinol methylase